MKEEKLTRQINTLIFDLGRVLVQVDFTRGLFRHYLPHRQADDQEMLNLIFKDEIFIAFSTGKMEPLQLYQKLRTKYRLNLAYAEFVKEWCDIFTPMDGMADLVQELSATYSLSILSDTDPLHWPYCRQQFSFLQLFSKPTLSFETGFLKPDPRCYRIAAENNNTVPESCLFIDDREENVRGALQVGMSALLFSGVESLREDLKNLEIL